VRPRSESQGRGAPSLRRARPVADERVGNAPVGNERERGSSLVEFALILPILVMLLLGIVTGAQAYGEKLSLANGAREGGRYGATLPIANFSTMNAWLDDVAAKSVNAVDGGLPVGLSGRATCVAYVYPNGTDTLDRTSSRRENAAGTVTYGTTACFTDSRSASERRIQVTLARNAKLDALLVKSTIGLAAKSLSRFEAIAG
jgi:Flp pilus assembly protein TadG